jgi:glucose/arabinose dehydrogenase
MLAKESEVVQTFRSARHGRTKGLHYDGHLRPWRVSASFILVSLTGAVAGQAQTLRTTVYASGFNSPVAFVQDPADRAVQYVVEQGGRIRVLLNGVVSSTPFLDLTSAISTGGERGLLGLAFEPPATRTGRFYVNFTDTAGNTVVARFRRSSVLGGIADAASRFDLRWQGAGAPAFIAQPFANHNSGNLMFGPDGFLYIGLGDGGSAGDPDNRAQTPSDLLGKMLRVDVNVPDSDPIGYKVPPGNPFVGTAGTRPEIWSFGWRNPWRYSFDDPARGGTGALVVGDVGQGAWEEVDYEPANRGGRNYGWRLREGAHNFDTSKPPAFLPLVEPIHEYDHGVGVSITGGYVYRGIGLGPAFKGRYFFADFTGRVWSMGLTINPSTGEAQKANLTEHTAALGGTGTLGNISSFGVDANGELYIVGYSRGTILKVMGTPATSGDFDNDGIADLAVYRPSTGSWFVRSSTSNFTTSSVRQWGLGGDVPVQGDYDGDGTIDLAVWRPFDGNWYILASSTGFIPSQLVHLGLPSDVPVPGDYDGDGRMDPAVYTPSTGLWQIRKSSTNYASSILVTLGGGIDVPVPADYDHDGITDVAVYRPSTGVWSIRTSSSPFPPTVTFQWGFSGDVPVPADYDGDGIADLAVYRPATGVWFILQSTTSFATSVSFQWGLSADIPVPGDYDGDGKTDLAVFRPGTATWLIKPSTTGYTTFVSFQWGLSGDVPTPNGPIAYAMAAGAPHGVSKLANLVRASDFDGDGRSDFTVYRPSTGTWFTLRSSTNYTTSTFFTLGVGSDLPVTGDFDGDDKTDAATFTPSTGMWTILRSSLGTTIQYQWGLNGDVPVPGDYDGDGKTDLAVFRPANGVWYIRRSSTNFTAFVSYQWGLGGDVPVPGDFDSDGITDLAVYRPTTGEWFIRLSTTAYATFVTYQWGLGGDVSVPGDYDGDGKTDLAVYRPSTGVWYLRPSSTSYAVSVTYQWGLDADVPVPGDFDGDGRTDLAVFRPSTGTWFFLKSGTAFTVSGAVPWGVPGDTPILGRR